MEQGGVFVCDSSRIQVCSVTSNSFANLWTVALQAPLSMRFSGQEYWSGWPFLSSGDLPNPGIKPMSLCLLHWQTSTKHQEFCFCFPTTIKGHHFNTHLVYNSLLQALVNKHIRNEFSLGYQALLYSPSYQFFLPEDRHLKLSLIFIPSLGTQKVIYFQTLCLVSLSISVILCHHKELGSLR